MKSTGIGSGKATSSGVAESGRNVRKRVMANERERERTKSLNQALEILRSRIPVPEAEKKSKIQTLRMAKEYIEFLGKVKKLSTHQASNNNNNHQVDDNNHTQHYSQVHASQQQQQQQPSSTTTSQPDSPLTYKFYKFRLKSQTRGNFTCAKLEVDSLCNSNSEVPAKISSPNWCNNPNALPQPSHQSAKP